MLSPQEIAQRNKPIVVWSRVDRLLLDMDGTLLDLGFDNHFWQEFVPRIWGDHQLPVLT